MQRTKLLRSTLAGLVAFAVSPAVMAQAQCEEDTCPAGYTCEEVSYDNCVWACEEDGECTVSDCVTENYTSCQRAACETDADCGDEMVCQTLTTNCATPSTPPCAPGEECPEPPPILPCENTEYNQCTPRSELPCEDNSDCGAGFDCVPAVMCSCGGATEPGQTPTPGGGVSDGDPGGSGSGSGSSGTSGGAAPGAAPAPPVGAPLAPVDPSSPDAPVTPGTPGELPLPPDDCTCEPSGTNYCQMQNIECETDSDCPTDWSCVASPGACWADSEGNTGCAEGSSQCYPPGNPGGEPLPTAPVVDGPGLPGVDNGGTPEPAILPQPSEGEESAPEPAILPQPEPGDDDGQGGGGSVGGLFGLFGCSVNNTMGTGSSTSPWAALGLGLGAALLRRRRR